jgi:hypothetical protein
VCSAIPSRCAISRWKSFEFAEHKNFTAAGWKFSDGLSQQVGFLPAADGFGHVGGVIEDVQRIRFRYRKSSDDSAPAQQVEGGVAGGGEQQAAGRLDGAAFVGAEHADEGVLDDVLGVG